MTDQMRQQCADAGMPPDVIDRVIAAVEKFDKIQQHVLNTLIAAWQIRDE